MTGSTPDHLHVPARFCGPPGSANGGYVAGLLAEVVLQAEDRDPFDGTPVTVSLRRPPPLDVPLDLTPVEDGLVLGDPDDPVALAAPDAPPPDPVGPVPAEVADAASSRFPGRHHHPFPSCFGCGPDHPDGLRLFPGPVAGDDRLATTWTPSPGLFPSAGEMATAITWAALDCTGGWAGGMSERTMVLARMTGSLDALPVPGETHVLVGGLLGVDGRKVSTACTLYDADERVVGRAEQLWITIDPARFGAAAR